ncbi:PAS domain S-box protein [Paucibacter sp. KBW04]|uniref:sensor histidine kinase n=1 Tax=Paucibacter sp. KBW04 TaxID=2153361 RepID=UPI001E29C23E|nr:PAS domain S-box protein [Paucibacter sp. KBW04]
MSRTSLSPVLRRGLLALLAALLLALAAWAAGHWAERRELQIKVQGLQRAVEVHALGLRGAAEKFDYLPFTAAQHPLILALLRQPLDAAARLQANRYVAQVQTHSGAAALYLLDAQGKALAASNWQTSDSFVGQNYASRPYFEEAMRGQRSVFYGVGLTTGVPGLFIAAPVRADAAGPVLGVMVVKVSLDALEATWAKAQDPVLLYDARGIAFLGSVKDWYYRSRQPLSPADLAWLDAHGQYGGHRSYATMPWADERVPDQAEYRIQTRIAGRQRQFLALDQALPELGWTLTVMSDLAELRQARNLAQALAALAGGLGLLGALYWRLRERRFAEQRLARLELEQRVQERTRELQEAHAFRKAMEDSLLVGMRARAPDGRIIYVNPALCEMVGYRAEELLGAKPPYPYWHPDDLDQHWRDSEAALSGRAALNGFESRVRHRDGHEVYTMVYTAPLIDAAGQHSGWMSSVVDITAQKQAEERQRLQDAQLQRSARLAGLGEMASTLAHELNQPLMALSNFALAARAFAEQGSINSQGLLIESLDEIVAQAQRAAEIVKRLRGLVRQRGGVHEAVDIAALLARVQALLAPELRLRKARLRLKLQEGLPAVRGDPLLLEQLMINLLMNALQAGQELAQERRQIEIEVSVEAQVLSLQVRDHGPGIAPELLGHLFDPFFSTKPDGLGLGLKICRSIAEAHGGALSAANRLDGPGACFSLSLPLPP